MQGFEAQTADFSCGWWGWSKCNKLRFKMTCCNVDENDPTPSPVSNPTPRPIADPTHHPVAHPTHKPTDKPNAEPTHHPIPNPTEKPTREPTLEPTHKPSHHPVAHPTHQPNAEPTHHPIPNPTEKPTKEPTLEPTYKPSHHPVAEPTLHPNAEPTLAPNPIVEEKLEKKLEKEGEKTIKEIQDKIQHDKDSIELQQDKESLKALEKVVDEIDKIQEAREGLICHFTFESGITKVEVPAGCVFFGETDINVAEQKNMITPAAYICTDKHSPKLITSDIFKKYGLVTDKKSLISMIKPGSSAKVEFYSHDDLKGSKGTFTYKTRESLTTYYYKDNRVSANDNVMSALVTSSTDTLPSSCKELKYSDKMSLISQSNFHSKNK